MRAGERGFTLIEVLIALVIAATALALGFGAVQGSARRTAQVETSMLAGWAIDNVVNDITLRAENIEAGRHRYIETMLGRTLVLEADVERLALPPTLSIAVSVRDVAAPDAVLDTAEVRMLVSALAGGGDATLPR